MEAFGPPQVAWSLEPGAVQGDVVRNYPVILGKNTLQATWRQAWVNHLLHVNRRSYPNLCAMCLFWKGLRSHPRNLDLQWRLFLCWSFSLLPCVLLLEEEAALGLKEEGDPSPEGLMVELAQEEEEALAYP